MNDPVSVATKATARKINFSNSETTVLQSEPPRKSKKGGENRSACALEWSVLCESVSRERSCAHAWRAAITRCRLSRPWGKVAWNTGCQIYVFNKSQSVDFRSDPHILPWLIINDKIKYSQLVLNFNALFPICVIALWIYN